MVHDNTATATFNGGDGVDSVLVDNTGIFNGDAGNDFVSGNNGTVNGGAGDDRVDFNLEGATFNGGEGTDMS